LDPQLSEDPLGAAQGAICTFVKPIGGPVNVGADAPGGGVRARRLASKPGVARDAGNNGAAVETPLLKP